MRNARMKTAAVGLFAAAAVMLPACASSAIEGTAVPSTTGVADFKADQASSSVTVDSSARELVEQAVSEVNDFWEASGVNLDAYVSFTGDTSEDHCRTDDPATPAWACIGDFGNLSVMVNMDNMSDYAEKGGTYAVFTVIGHEIGHLGMYRILGEADLRDSAWEPRADCAAGSFMRAAAKVNKWDESDIREAAAAISNTERMKHFDYGFESTSVQRCSSYLP